MATSSARDTPAAVTSQADATETHSPSEHIIIGVDIGYTYTGVAICSADVDPTQPIKPVPIQQWPGTDAFEIINKVPTLVAYRAADLRVQSWGYECPPRWEFGRMEVRGRFKFLLDEEELEKANREALSRNPESIENIKKFFSDFLAELHEHIVAHLANATWRVDWGFTKVDYIFSLPTSWENKDELVEEFREIAEDAGFGAEDKCTLTIGLTEGVASAVCTAKSVGHNYREGDILLVCDAGGGTTDICALRVVRIEGMTVELETIQQLSIFVGSTQIDDAFADLFKKKLQDKRNEQPGRFRDFVVDDHAPQDVARGYRFQTIKLSCGTGRGIPKHAHQQMIFSVPGLPDSESAGVPGDDMETGRIGFLPGEIEALFDTQIQKIITEIDKMLNDLRQDPSHLIVSSLFLCGGLGSSTYVQSKLIAYYQPKGMDILFDKDPSEPPLSVCKGLVLDRMQRLLHGTSVLRTRRCRASYGVLGHEIYDKTKHKGQEIYKNPADGRAYVTGHIEWFICKGDIVEEGTITTLERTHITTLGNPDMTWSDTIVASKISHKNLPKYLCHGDSWPVCTITSTSQPRSLTPKRKYWVAGKKFLYGRYNIQVSMEHENLRFETRGNGIPVTEGQTLQVPWVYTQDGELVHT